MEVYQTNLQKFVNSLTDEQVLCLGAELSEGNGHKLNEVLLDRFRKWDDTHKLDVRNSALRQFSNRVQ